MKEQSYYQRNKKRILKKQKQNNRKRNKQSQTRRAKNRKFVSRVKQIFGCQLCGYKKSSWALDLHHKDETQKDFSISYMISQTRSLEKIKEEMRKCVILCANCHREIHEEIKQGIMHEWD